MANKMLLPQEIETFYVIPTLRRHLALNMKAAGMKQKDIAKILGINTAAISQYTSNKRGNKVAFTPRVLEEIKNASTKIKDQMTYLQQTQRLLRFIRESNELCQVHKLFSDVPDHCDPKEMGCHAGGTC